ncbi:hypothetical protein [Streptomyces sp. NPDC003077]|uniref:hypothetical protein n=1 Tax=Streptomyces sp. NPDC003077 TaxID=3154443 RepID=UPI0033ACDB39
MPTRSPNTHLKALLDERSLPYDTVARTVRRVAAEAGQTLRTNRSTVEHWLCGAQPTGATPRYLAEALSRLLGRLVTVDALGLGSPTGGPPDDRLGLSLGPDPVETLTLIGRADVNRRSFLSTSAYSVAAAALPLESLRDHAGRAAAVRSGAVAGLAEAAAVRDMVSAFTELDERHGGAHGRYALAQYLTSEVAPLCRGRFRTEDARAEVLSAAASGVHLAGWKAYDAGEQGLAQRYFLQCFALADESRILGHEAFVMRTMAHQGMRIHPVQHCLALAETSLARVKGRVAPPVEALFRITHAYALTKSGGRRQAAAVIDQAHACLEADTGDPPPFWAMAWGPIGPTVHNRTAKALSALGDPRNAAQYYARAAAGRPADTYGRIIALNLADQAKSEAAQGSIEQACVTWHRALDHMDGIASARISKVLAGLRRDLARYRTRGPRCVTEIDERARSLLTV